MVKAFCFAVLLTMSWLRVASAQDNPWITNDEKGVQVLIGYLEKEDSFAVRVALEALAGMGNKSTPALPAIKKVLDHADAHLRIEAARTLLDLNAETDAAIKTIREATKHKDAEVRARAVSAIGHIANPVFTFVISCWGPPPRPQRPYPAIGKPAIPDLCAALKDPSRKVRAAAAWSLGRIGNHAVGIVPGLILALGDNDSEVASAAITALSEFGPSASDAVPALEAIVTRRDKTLGLDAVEALLAIDEKAFYRCALPVLLDAVHSQSDSSIRHAGHHITKWVVKGKDAEKVVDTLLHSKEPLVRCYGLMALMSCPATQERMIREFDQALHDEHHWVRREAVMLLGKIAHKNAKVTPSLMKALKDTDHYVRQRAIFGLMTAGLEAKAALPILMHMANDPQEAEDVRLAATRALWHVGADNNVVLGILMPMLKHKSYEWRRNAAYSLGDMKDQAKTALPLLVDRLKRDEWLVIEGAIWAVQQLGPDAVASAIETLIASLDDADPNVRRTVPLSLSFFDNEGKCVPAVMDRLQKGEKDLRWAYIDCLGRMESKAKMAIPLLKQLSRDPDDDVRRHACMALERIEGR